MQYLINITSDRFSLLGRIISRQYIFTPGVVCLQIRVVFDGVKYFLLTLKTQREATRQHLGSHVQNRDSLICPYCIPLLITLKSKIWLK